MKKISFITVHVGFNFGSILQTIATFKILQDLGFSPMVVNYIPPRCTWKYYFSFSNLIRFFKNLIRFPIQLFNTHIYQSFLKKHVDLSCPIYSEDNFAEACPRADIYLTGSDQVWNSKHNQGLDKHYYFDGFPTAAKKIAYSSSIGRDSIDETEFFEVKRMLSSYHAISVREANAKELIESMGYEAEHVLDPTFMLNREMWKSYMSKRLIKDKYLLVYAPYDVRNKDIVYKSAHQIAQQKHLKVVTFSWGLTSEKLADKTIIFANPGDFLSLMYYADYVITTSFHGTAFSINLNKQFSVYFPTGFSARIKSVLALCRLEDRILEPNEILRTDKADVKINYIEVNSILNTEREKALRFLEKALND